MGIQKIMKLFAGSTAKSENSIILVGVQIVYHLHKPGNLHYGGVVQPGFRSSPAAQNTWRALQD